MIPKHETVMNTIHDAIQTHDVNLDVSFSNKEVQTL